ncbi:MAG: acetyltransferase [Alistipes sp.]|nr:acetyltransferase [Alistipes sp.]
MYLYGASCHAKVIIDILEACGVEVEGLFDDNEALSELQGYPVSRYDAACEAEKIVSIGNNIVRKAIAERIGGRFGIAVHPSAILSPRAKIGEGTVVMHGAIVQADVQIGKHAIVNTGATIDHECVIGDYAHISPNATLCGNVVVGEGTQIGAGAVVVPGVRIGKWSLICAGSVVTKDIPDNCIASGNRCEVVKYIK